MAKIPGHARQLITAIGHPRDEARDWRTDDGGSARLAQEPEGAGGCSVFLLSARS